MQPQGYPLNADIWHTRSPDEHETAAVIGWAPDDLISDNWRPVVAVYSTTCDDETAFTLDADWNWRFIR